MWHAVLTKLDKKGVPGFGALIHTERFSLNIASVILSIFLFHLSWFPSSSYNRGRLSGFFMHDLNNNSVCTHFEPAPIFIHTHVMLIQDIVVIHSTENCHSWSGSCRYCVEWTLLNRKYGGGDETPTVLGSLVCLNFLWNL